MALKMLTAQITAIATDTTVSAKIEGTVRHKIPTVANVAQPPVAHELWVFLLDGTTIVGLGPSYNWPT